MFVEDLRLSTGLGDARATARVLSVARAMADNPKASLPNIFTVPSALSAVYRMANRDDTTAEGILEGPAKGVIGRCAARDAVLVLHDTTEFAFTDFGCEREHLAQLTKNRHGFQSHFSLAVSADEDHEVLGVLSHIPFVHTSQVDVAAASWWKGRGGLYDTESLRWQDAVDTCESLFTSARPPRRYHICDREADHWDLFALLKAHETGFVVRCNYRDRIVLLEDGNRGTVESELAQMPPGIETRRISVPQELMGPDGKPLTKKKNKIGSTPVPPPRRWAEVSVRYTSLLLPATKSSTRVTGVAAEDVVRVYAVEVVEHNPPKDMMPASWILHHSDEVVDDSQAWQVVDWYRARWGIEEFFKAIKTGVAFEARQLTTAHGLLNILAVSAVVACDILSLRTYERHQPDAPADIRFEPEVIDCAQRLHPKLMPSARPTMKELLAVVARMGGHIKQNGPPGWQVLYRGFVSLMASVQTLQQLGIQLKNIPPKGTE